MSPDDELVDHPAEQARIRRAFGRETRDDASDTATDAATLAQRLSLALDAFEHNGSDRPRAAAALPRRTIRRHEMISTRSFAARWPWRAAAAVLATGVVIVAAVQYQGHHTDGSKETLTYATARGESVHITLPDGSRASLAPATTMTVSRREHGARMTATVHGQAIFSVIPNARRTFTVQSGALVARVLGTRFMVRHYTGDTFTRVAVSDGKVALHVAAANTEAAGTVLSAGMTALVHDSAPARTALARITYEDTAWVTGELVFRKTSVRDIVADIGRAYDVSIQLGDSALARQTLTWTVPVARQTLTEVLDALSTALDAHVIRANGVITLRPGVPAARAPLRRILSSSLESQHGR
jgi:ferric-dicitrate binding protein FerR (iron transport regulator)